MGVPIAFVTVVLVWTTTPLGIHISNETLSFSASATLRMLGGVALASCVLLWLRQGLALRKAWPSYLAGSIGVFGAMLITYWSAQYIPSGLIAVLYGLAPVSSAVIAAVMLKERVTGLQVIGLLLSLGGLFLVFQDDLVLGAEGYKGVIGVSIAAILFPFSSITVRRINAPISPMQQTAGTLLVASFAYVLVWALIDGEIPNNVSNRSIAAVAYLAAFGSVIGFGAFFYLVQRVSAAQVAVIPVITPVLAVIVGAVFNNEVLGLSTLMGAACIVAAVVFAELGQRKGRQKVVATAPVNTAGADA
ncbi:MAG: EamA family transporter [Gammaproteobacteria bacterium]|nr:EamA family transporter [Gammaproteobacteria bacterium]